MSDPYEKQWEKWQNKMCEDCPRVGWAEDREVPPGYEGDYATYSCCKFCRADMEDEMRGAVQAAYDWYWDHKFMESRGE